MIPTSNHNVCKAYLDQEQVVYLLIPTSNHNKRLYQDTTNMLYIFWFLHQTTTAPCKHHSRYGLYIFWFLHQTTTASIPAPLPACCISFDSYIKPQLGCTPRLRPGGCISFDSYIKPQLRLVSIIADTVVYLLIPTSNHNLHRIALVIHLLYIFWFLHQTTTFYAQHPKFIRCISFDSYIKPQPDKTYAQKLIVVYLLIPTSNHNIRQLTKFLERVVYLLIPTSNHNFSRGGEGVLSLYIFWFLHQTTTDIIKANNKAGCISFDSYIKPQLITLFIFFNFVVYLLIPTSNHNGTQYCSVTNALYIFWFLHQTTTWERWYRTD